MNRIDQIGDQYKIKSVVYMKAPVLYLKYWESLMSVRVFIENGSSEARFSVICILWGLNREAQKRKFLNIFHSEKFCFDFYVGGLQYFAAQKRTAPF